MGDRDLQNAIVLDQTDVRKIDVNASKRSSNATADVIAVSVVQINVKI